MGMKPGGDGGFSQGTNACSLSRILAGEEGQARAVEGSGAAETSVLLQSKPGDPTWLRS